jgi:ABC-type branched-subunit amino acid transport system permease subunit
LLFPITPFGMAVLILIGTLGTTSLGRRDEIGLTAITTAVVMIVASSDSENALQQPLLRLVDTVTGIAIGVVCKWTASLMFYRIVGEEMR